MNEREWSAIETYYRHQTVCGYGELSADEQVDMALEATAEGCANIMRVAQKTECPPDAVALVVLMRQLVAGLQENNILLIRSLAEILGQRQRRVTPAVPGSRLVH